ncbi:RagB/SusD family nutrient uptake outer membrane protein [Dyadobacter sp. CY312]|uniref:RagB/SusD family nutrient uptake outer membrane protein n=1 Tax=Dyadobacter sp. CY312 TaxID=2907303 RepID=UPI001F3A6565|nr:RagB/SusD family nutrient uptake outer membrane protein [Dyadobacter sp. CY312]MCE7042521.1 RagB/SusD family nutrient uptake outer membrane protein [Dyadobacter sp. CY312]
MIRKFSYLLVALASFTSCRDDFFDTAPATQITTPEVFSSEANIDAFVNGSIRFLLENSTSQDNPGLPTVFLTHDVMGEDAFARDGRYGFRDSYPYRDPFDNTTRRALFFWTLQYTSIDHSNNIIANVKIDETSKASLKHLKGQAYALRGHNYLNLVRQYQFTYVKDANAKAVPIYTEPTTPLTEPKPLATVKEVYDQVISDLTEAEKLLSGFERTVKNRPDLNVVYGLFARTYLTQEKWDLARDYAAKARVGYPIMTPQQYTEGFSDVSNSEWIWGHPQTVTQNKGGSSYLAYIETTPYATDATGTNLYYGYNSIMPDPNFIALFDPADIRKSLFEIAKQPTEALYRGYRYKKFRNKYPNHEGHIVLMRSSEQLLIEAESEARLGNLPAAIETLNELRRKRNLADLPAGLDKNGLIEEILLERRKELWGEGFRLYDILRTQTAPVRKETTEKFVDTRGNTVNVLGHWITKFPDGTALVPNSKYYLFPIPLNEINNNPNLQ